MVDLTGRRRGRRLRGRIGAGFGLLILAVIAVTTAVLVVTGARNLVKDQGDQDAYDKAPYCAVGGTQTESCVLRTTADVEFVYASKNTGKSAHGYTTRADLDPEFGEIQTVKLSSSKDLTDSVSEGDRMPVLVWRDQITRFTFAGKTHDADENPHHLVASDLAQVALCLIVASCSGRPLIRRALHSRTAINLRRNRIPDWTLVALSLVTVVAALLRASYVVVAFGIAGIAVLVVSVVWPFIPWVASFTASQRPYVNGSRTRQRRGPNR